MTGKTHCNRVARNISGVMLVVLALCGTGLAGTGTPWVEQQKLTASDGAGEDWYGLAVAISADTAVVGSYWADDLGSKSGSVYVYHRTGGSWVQQAKLNA